MINTQSFGYMFAFFLVWLAQATVWFVLSRWIFMRLLDGVASVLRRIFGGKPAQDRDEAPFIDHLANDTTLEPGAFGCVDTGALLALFVLTYLEMRWFS